MIKENEPELVAFLEPQQLAMSPGGAAKLVHCTRMMMEREKIRHETKETAEEQGELGPFQEEEVGFLMDVVNAFNCCARPFSGHHPGAGGQSEAHGLGYSLPAGS